MTIAGGALFGSIGLIIAAPLVAAISGIVKDLKAAEPAPDDKSDAGPGPQTAPT